MELRVFKMSSSIFFLIFALIAVEVNAENKTAQEIFEENFYTHENECTKQTTCEPLTNTTFFGTQLPYAMTTSDLIPGLEKSSHMIAQRFHQLKVAQYIPDCWKALQPLLSALYKPKCLNGYYRVPGFRMCINAWIACEPIRNHPIWPEFINCNNKTLFPKSCKNPTTNIEFNQTSQCMEPSITSDSSSISILSIDGCGLPCYDPSLSQEEHQRIDTIVWYGAWICIIFNIFSILTIMLSHPVKAPAYTVLYTNILIVIFCVGSILQFTPLTSREEIACHKDGSRKIREPITSNFMSALVFVLIHYPMVGVLLQWLFFLHQFNRSISREPLKWSLKPLNIIILGHMCLVLYFGKIDGSGITGITFMAPYYKTDLLYCVIFAHFCCLSLGITYNLALPFILHLRYYESSEFRWIMTRIKIISYTFLTPVFYIYFHTVCDAWSFANWLWSFRSYILCKIFNTLKENNECSMTKTSMLGKQFLILAFFFIGILVPLLVCTKSGFQSWVNFFRGIAGNKQKVNKFALLIDFDKISDKAARLKLKKETNDLEKQKLRNNFEKQKIEKVEEDSEKCGESDKKKPDFTS